MDLEDNFAVFFRYQSEILRSIAIEKLDHLIDENLLGFTSRGWRENLGLYPGQSIFLLRRYLRLVRRALNINEFAFRGVFGLRCQLLFDFTLYLIREQLQELRFLKVSPVVAQIEFAGSDCILNERLRSFIIL